MKKSFIYGLVIALISGCAASSIVPEKEKVKVVIANWPPETKAAELAEKNKLLEEMNKKYDNIEYVPETWSATPESFLVRASSNQLPTIYPVYFTEAKKIISAGYAADITEHVKKYEEYIHMNDVTKNLVTENGRIYGIGGSEYCMALYANLDVFEKAGLLEEDGSIDFPDTYEELLKTASIIKEKTGKAGFVLPTASNWGGWYFMNIAWSFGAEFMKKNEDERWIACFDSPEAVAALQYVKDLKWKYDVLPEKTYIESNECLGIYASGEAAMTFGATELNDLVSLHGMDINKISMGKMPSGPAGRYSLLGGSVSMISPAATDEQIDGALMWLIDTRMENMNNFEENVRAELESRTKKGYIIGAKGLKRLTKENEIVYKRIMREYVNVDLKHFKDFNEGMEEMTLKVEEPINSQGLYNTLDECIRKVLEDPGADCQEIMTEACRNFQKTYLDDIEF